MTWRGVAIGSALLLAAACAAGSGARSAVGRGEITVEVYSGFAATAPALAPPPAHLVVDVSAMLMQSPEHAATSLEKQQLLARSLIARYLRQHAELGSESAVLHVFHRLEPAARESCSDPGSGASVAASSALAHLSDELASGDHGPEARVVLFADFAAECAPRLCETAARMVERGAWLDVVALGGRARLPACLEGLRPSPKAPIAWLAEWSAVPPPAFTVEAVTSAEVAPAVIARGSAGTPVRAPEGLLRVRISLDPPLLVGPIRLRANERLRIRVMDFPLSAPTSRSWQVEPIDAKR